MLTISCQANNYQMQLSKASIINPPHHKTLLTSELQTPELKGDEAVADLNDVHQSVEVVRCQDETVACVVVPPASKQQVSAQAVLQRARQVLVENRV